MNNFYMSLHNVKSLEMTEAKRLNETTHVRDLYIVGDNGTIHTLTLFSYDGEDALQIKGNEGGLTNVITE